MDTLQLKCPNSKSLAEIAPQFGLNCFQFQADVAGRLVDVLSTDPDVAVLADSPCGHGIPILFPFPNRIRDGIYRWNGREYDLKQSSAMMLGPNAIHGFCANRAWRVIEHGNDYAIGEFQLSKDAADLAAFWPADFIIQTRYTLKDACLRADFVVTNPDQQPLPFGLGTHPYFRVPLSTESKPESCLVQAPVTSEWILKDLLPTGQRKPLSDDKPLPDGIRFGDTQLDDFFTGLEIAGNQISCSIIDETAGLELTQTSDAVFGELVIYTPPNRHAVCIEPYTCTTDAINLQQQNFEVGWQTLEPGGKYKTWIEIQVGPVLA